MFVLGLQGSPRIKGNTSILLSSFLAEAERLGAHTQNLDVARMNISPCQECGTCEKKGFCPIDDDMQQVYPLLRQADIIVMATPIFFYGPTAQMKALIDRAGMVARANSDMLFRKVGAAVVAVRRCGAIHVFNSMNHFFFIGQMIVPGSSYWNLGIGRQKGEVEKDDEGIKTMQDLGRNMAWLLKKLNR